MKYKKLGSSSLLVSEICLGTMTFAGDSTQKQYGNVDQKMADALVARALDKGVNFIDTADVYSEGHSEVLTGRAMKNSGRKRTDIVLASKVFARVGPGVNDRGA